MHIDPFQMKAESRPAESMFRRGLSDKESRGPSGVGPRLKKNRSVSGFEKNAGSGFDQFNDISFRSEALKHALKMAYLMEPHAYLSQMTSNPKSSLGGDMLRMYLYHKVDPDVIADVAEEIMASKKFSDYREMLQKKVQEYIDTKNANPNVDEVKNITSEILTALRKKEGIAFRGALNPVIGGVTGISVKRAQVLQEVPKSGRREREYLLTICIEDSYDFDNDRSGLKQYNELRNNLYRLIIEKKYIQFWYTYYSEYVGGKSMPRAFASYMYAIERAGITSGPLYWSADVGMSLKLNVAA